MNFSTELLDLSYKLVRLAIKNNIKISTAESCSGGLVSALITCVSGSSEVFDCGFITYSNDAKNKMIGVNQSLLKEFGAVSKEVADKMAQGVIKNSNANLSISITGVAGPNSDNSNKKVGLVFISSFNKNTNKLISKKFEFDGNRDQIRNLSVKKAILILIDQINNEAN